MNTGKQHFLLAVFGSQIFAVFFFSFQFSLIDRNRNIILTFDVGRIGKGPEIFRARFLFEKSSYSFLMELLQLLPCRIHTVLYVSNQLCLIFTKITFHVGIIRKRMRRMRKESFRSHSETFFLQAELSVQHIFLNFRIRKIHTHIFHTFLTEVISHLISPVSYLSNRIKSQKIIFNVIIFQMVFLP